MDIKDSPFMRQQQEALDGLPALPTVDLTEQDVSEFAVAVCIMADAGQTVSDSVGAVVAPDHQANPHQ